MNINDLQDLDYFESCVKRLDLSNRNYIFRGAAGTGKTTLIHLIKKRINKNIAVLAFTGIAACNVGGSTIHSFFSFPSRIINPDKDLDIPAEKRKIIQALEILIIDEYSMVSAYLLDAIDITLRKIRKKKDLLFGGVKLVLVGDHMQLPPIIDKTGLEILESIYPDSLHFFNAKSYNHNNFEIETLTKIYRQDDPVLIKYLNKVRDRNFTNKDLIDFNNLVLDKDVTPENIITLTFTNKQAELINQEKLDDINSDKYIYKCEETGYKKVKCTAERELILKVGARVMMLKNHKFWNNGTLATISRLNEKSIWVNIKGNEYEVEKDKWESFTYKLGDKTKDINNILSKVVGTFTQFPIKLAWAATVHKSQGQTFESMILDTGRGAFAHGQTYSALSRAKNIDGLFFKKKLTKNDFVYDGEVMIYHKKEQDYIVDSPFTT